jgi:tRNA A-37 threonylcarbamoyl transferase component Bud32
LTKPKDIKYYFTEIRDYYYKYLSKISEKSYVIDKTPLNCRWIGYIVNAFPEAKIIHIDRNPMAVCWSNYKTLFVDSGLDFSLSQENTAKYYILYNDLMKFWFKKFNNQIININYEDFVQDFELQTKNILLKLNLDWEDELRNYEKTHRVVKTASFNQVRDKIKKNTSKQWEKYSDYLKPMQKILKNNQIKF